MTRSDVAMPGDVRPHRARIALAAAGIIVFAALLALGTWQVQRLAWKNDLVARVEARVNAPPVDVPGPSDWSGVTARADEYRHVRLAGTFLHDCETLVQAVTERGPGFWVVTPVRRDDGSIVLVNRGFVPSAARAPAARQASLVSGTVEVVGLLRMSEPGGGFLRENDAGADRWFSRDVAAIASARRLDRVAPFFVDADATPNPGGLPVGGLTVVAFANHHLVYAVTWYALAAMLAGVAVHLARDRRRRRVADQPR